MTDQPTEPGIVCEFYESRRLLKWFWRFRFVGRNSERLGDPYTERRNAVETAALIVNPDVSVLARVYDRDGNLTDEWQMR
jgi:hypothetical protein